MQPIQPPTGESLVLQAVPSAQIRAENEPPPVCECGAPLEGVEVTAAVAEVRDAKGKPLFPAIPARFAYMSRYCEKCVNNIRADEARQTAATLARRQKLALENWWEQAWEGKTELHKTEPSKIPDQAALAQVLEWHPEDGVGLIAQGVTGRGKTRSVYLLLKALCFLAGYRPQIWNAIKLRQAITDAARSDTPGERARLIKRITGGPFLFIDDLGQMSSTPASMEAILEIVDDCTTAGVPIIATTQFSGEAFIQTFTNKRQTGEAVSRRLEENCKIIKFT